MSDANFWRGHSLTTLKRFWPFLTTYLSQVDICERIPSLLYLRENLHTYSRHFKYHLPTSSCQHSLWMPPNGDSLYYLTIIWGFHRRLQIIEIQKSRMFCGKLVSEPNNLSQIFGNCWQNYDYPGLRVGGKLDFLFISQYVYLKITI